MFRECVDYILMDKWLEEYAPDITAAEIPSAAKSYFQQTGEIRGYSTPFYEPIDIIICPDTEFISICDHLPVSLEDHMFEEPVIKETHLFALDSDCHFFRHLNHIPPVEHAHDFFEICYVWQGDCTQLCNHQTYELTEGDFFVIPPGLKHQIFLDHKDSIIFNISIRKNAFYQSFFSLLTFNNAISAFLRNCLFGNDMPHCLLIHTDNSVYLKRIIKHFAHDCYEDHTVTGDYTADILKQAFRYMITRGTLDISFTGEGAKASYMEMFRYIQDNYLSVTLSNLAEHFYMSEAYLSRLIKKLTGQNFSEIIRTIKIEKARQLLTRTDLSIEEISSMAGYSEIGSFRKAFKAETKYSPSQYRELSRMLKYKF